MINKFKEKLDKPVQIYNSISEGKLNSGVASIVVSSKNASPCKEDVIISEDNQLQWKSD